MTRFLLIKAGFLPAILLCGFVLATQSALAATFNINDLTDTLTVTTDTPSRLVTVSPCPVEVCRLDISAPSANATVNFASFSPSANLVVRIGETSASNALLSDDSTVQGVGTPQVSKYTIFLTSEHENNFVAGSDCGVTPCTITEDGTLQTAWTVTWSDDTVDTIKFQSDPESAVPEPSSILLVLPGLAGVWAARRTRFVVQ